MNKNLTIKMGNCNHRKYIPSLLAYIESNVFDPSLILSQVIPMSSVVNAYKEFDKRHDGWVKVEIIPGM
jgi:threonine dehydrogenase-like Zn-dependent dehydrogenase